MMVVGREGKKGGGEMVEVGLSHSSYLVESCKYRKE
jgi:hypothetical protein